jgi:hypothetical protein
MRNKRSNKRKSKKVCRQRKTVKTAYIKQLGGWLNFVCRFSQLVIQWIHLFKDK